MYCRGLRLISSNVHRAALLRTAKPTRFLLSTRLFSTESVGVTQDGVATNSAPEAMERPLETLKLIMERQSEKQLEEQDFEGFNFNILSPVPLLPDPSSTPTPITREHFWSCILPMYTRGWRIAFTDIGTVKMTALDVPVRHVCSPGLRKKFTLSGWENAAKFAQDVLRIANEQNEKVQPVVVIEGSSVTITVQDRSIPIPTELHTEDLSTSQLPALTLTGLRYSILVDNQHDQYLPSEERIRDPSSGYTSGQPKSVTDLNLQWQKRLNILVNGAKKLKDHNANVERKPRLRFCAICRTSGHEPMECPKRYTTLPPPGQWCKYCGQEHWRINCPQTPVKEKDAEKPQAVQSEGSSVVDSGEAQAVRINVP